VVALPGRKRETPHPVDQPLLWDDLHTERVPDLFPWTSAPRLPADEEPLDFARGDPATDLLPLDSMWEGLSEVKRQGHAPLRYAPPQGNPELRARLAESLELRGMRASPSQILVLSGGGQGTYLAAQAFLERGDGVVVESPTYPEALRIFRAVGAQLRPVPLDEGGLRLVVLEETLSRFAPS
jgi:2-aminoadipate transaminase